MLRRKSGWQAVIEFVVPSAVAIVIYSAVRHFFIFAAPNGYMLGTTILMVGGVCAAGAAIFAHGFVSQFTRRP